MGDKAISDEKLFVNLIFVCFKNFHRSSIETIYHTFICNVLKFVPSYFKFFYAISRSFGENSCRICCLFASNEN